MINIVKNFNKKPVTTKMLVEFFQKKQEFSGKLYTNYLIGNIANKTVIIDALWISQEYGIVIFDLLEGDKNLKLEIITSSQDDLYNRIEASLVGYKELKIGRKLMVNIEVITFAPALFNENNENNIANSEKELYGLIKKLPKWKKQDLYKITMSIFQSMINLKISKKRPLIKNKNSKGAIVNKLEESIANLDINQESAIIEEFNGIQRIRGLAGSGKTIVLALKTAYIHILHPEWKIGVTFHTRSLKRQFENLLNKFCIQKTGSEYDKSRVKIIHAWGGKKEGEGIYFNFCIDHNIEYLDYNSAKNYKYQHQYFDKTIYEVICDKAIKEVSRINQNYDAILIDEAQDLSPSFLKMCFGLLREPKRLVYAYDELQILNEGSSLANPSSIFDRNIEKDTILNVCYRNSKPLLVTAHALGFGIYRNSEYLNKNEPKLVQFFDEPKLWRDIGYNLENGELKSNEKVILSRTEETSPSFLEKNLDDLIIFKEFNDKNSQATWVANEIKNNLDNDELLHKDIIVINPLTFTTKSEVTSIMNLLYDYGIRSSIAGAINPDIFMDDDSITFTGIHRAKGNEVPMVYIINAQDCFTGNGLIYLRNVLFTAITRSKAWVRVCGIGNDMEKFVKEYEEVKNRGYKLEFTYPSVEEIKKMNIIHRDLTDNEKQRIKNDKSLLKNIMKIVVDIMEGKKYIEDYSNDEQKIIEAVINNMQQGNK